jgi:hypothetical protein
MSLTGSGLSGDLTTHDFTQLSKSTTPMDFFGVIIVLAVKPGLAKKMERSAVIFRVSFILRFVPIRYPWVLVFILWSLLV